MRRKKFNLFFFNHLIGCYLQPLHEILVHCLNIDVFNCNSIYEDSGKRTGCRGKRDGIENEEKTNMMELEKKLAGLGE